MIIGIVAVDRNLAIGKRGQLPWHYSADMKFFKQTTIGNAVAMGRRTWLTLKGPLKDRRNIVLSRDGTVQPGDSLLVMSDVDAVLDFAGSLDSHLFVIGGARVYESFLPHIQRWIVTEVPLTVKDADTFMPANFLSGFEMYEMRQLDKGHHAYLLAYQRNAPLMALIEQYAMLNPEFLKLRSARVEAFAKRNSDFIRRLQDHGLADVRLDPLATAQALNAMVSRMAYLVFVHDYPLEFDTLLETLTQIWVNTLQLRDPDSAR